MTGHRIAIGKASIKDGKVQPKANTYRQKTKALKTARKVRAWAAKSKTRG